MNYKALLSLIFLTIAVSGFAAINEFTIDKSRVLLNTLYTVEEGKTVIYPQGESFTISMFATGNNTQAMNHGGAIIVKDMQNNRLDTCYSKEALFYPNAQDVYLEVTCTPKMSGDQKWKQYKILVKTKQNGGDFND